MPPSSPTPGGRTGNGVTGSGFWTTGVRGIAAEVDALRKRRPCHSPNSTDPIVATFSGKAGSLGVPLNEDAARMCTLRAWPLIRVPATAAWYFDG
jgi:hypothetical protein